MKFFIKFSLISIFLFAFAGIGFSAQTVDSLLGEVIESGREVSSQEVQSLAVEEGVLPAEVSGEDMEGWQEEGNSVLIWIASPPENSLALVEGIIRIHQVNQVCLGKDAEYYFNKINLAIFKGIEQAKINEVIDEGVVELIRGIAIMGGYYEDNRSKIEVLKEYLGQEAFDEYKERHPERYRRILNEAGQN